MISSCAALWNSFRGEGSGFEKAAGFRRAAKKLGGKD